MSYEQKELQRVPYSTIYIRVEEVIEISLNAALINLSNKLSEASPDETIIMNLIQRIHDLERVRITGGEKLRGPNGEELNLIVKGLPGTSKFSFRDSYSKVEQAIIDKIFAQTPQLFKKIMDQLGFDAKSDLFIWRMTSYLVKKVQSQDFNTKTNAYNFIIETAKYHPEQIQKLFKEALTQNNFSLVKDLLTHKFKLPLMVLLESMPKDASDEDVIAIFNTVVQRDLDSSFLRIVISRCDFHRRFASLVLARTPLSTIPDDERSHLIKRINDYDQPVLLLPSQLEELKTNFNIKFDSTVKSLLEEIHYKDSSLNDKVNGKQSFLELITAWFLSMIDFFKSFNNTGSSANSNNLMSNETTSASLFSKQSDDFWSSLGGAATNEDGYSNTIISPEPNQNFETEPGSENDPNNPNP